MKPDFLVFTTNQSQLWPAAARLFNELQIDAKSEEEEEVDDGGALSEDLELLEFSPLARSNRQPTGGDEQAIRANRIVELGKWFATQLDLSSFSLIMEQEITDRWLFTCKKQVENTQFLPTVDEIMDQIDAGLEAAKNQPEIFKILPRPVQQQRNVALTAIMKQKPVDEPPPPTPHPPPVQQKQPLLPLPPPIKPIVSGGYSRPSLPPRLEQLKAEQAQRQLFRQPQPFSGLSGLPDLSTPPPPPPGLGFHLPPPPAWSMQQLAPPTVSPYSLWSAGNQPAPNNPSFMLNHAAPSRPPTAGSSSLWSGPGPSPLERLLEQQKALRGASPANKLPKP